MINKGTIILIIACSALVPAACQINSGAGTTAAPWLEIGVGARPAAMGETYAAIGDDAAAMFWNPACLSRATKTSMMAMYGQWFADVGYHAIGLVMPSLDEFGVPRRAIGFGATSLQIGSIPQTTEGWVPGTEPVGTFSPGATAVIVSFSQGLGNAIAIGINGKMVSEKIFDATESAFTADLGMLLRAGNEESKFGIGLALQNFIGTLYGGSLPQNVKAGFGMNIGPLTLGVDINMPRDHGVKTDLGVEFMLGALALRGGYVLGLTEDELGSGGNIGLPAGLTIGAGLNTRSFGVDIAAMPYGSLGDTIRVSVVFKFGSDPYESFDEFFYD